MDNFIRGEKPKILIKSRHKSNFEMKVRGVLGVLSLVLLISCGKDTVVPEPTPIVPGSSDLKPVLFSVGTISEGRAEEMNSSNFIVDGRRLGVFAYKHSGELVDGVDIANVRNFPLTYRGTNWTYSPYLYWPNNADTLYSFVGIYPYMSDYSDQFSYNVDGENLSISYNLGSDASNQVDMLYAVAKNCSVEGGEVDLNFKHALSKVGLSIAGNVSGTGVDSVLIKEVQLLGVAKSGIMTVSSDFSEIDWSTGETTDVCILNGTQKLSATSTQIGDWQYLVPQNIETSPINVSLIYYVYTNSSNVPQTKKSVFELPNDVVASWEDNHTYNYTLSLNLSEVSFDVDIDVVDFESGADVDLNIPNPDDTLPETGELNVIYYRSTDGSVIEPYVEGDSPWGGAQIVSNTYDNGYGKIVFDDVVRRIGSGVFGAYTNSGKNSTLTSIIIPDSVKQIESFAFSGCTELCVVILPEGLHEIGPRAFVECDKLTSIEIPKNCTEIGIEYWIENGVAIKNYMNAFTFCSNLQYISVHEDNPKYDSRGDCNAIIETATNTLIVGCCKSIIPNSVIKISKGAFTHMHLTEIYIPNSVISIDENAFSNTDITTLVIPESVSYIGHSAFSSCDNLSTVTINSTSVPPFVIKQYYEDDAWDSGESTPFYVDRDIFEGCMLSSIYVPESAINDYANADGWVAYRHLINGFVEPEMQVIKEIVDTIKIPISAGYDGGAYSFPIDEIYEAFAFDDEGLQNAIDSGRVMFYGEDANGTLHVSNSDAYGCWWGESQNVVNWGSDARILFDGNHINNFTVRQYPGQVKVGDIYPTSHMITYFSNGETKAIRVKVDVEIVE